MPQARNLAVFAPAKINLYLHITGKRDDGYHLLDSLAVFADIGDRITFEPAGDFSFRVDGPYAGAFTAHDRDESAASTNLAVRAARRLAGEVKRDLNFRMTLTKNLPLAAGIGGGSSDAAAVLWGLMNLWGLSMTASPFLPGLMAELGADVPACLRCIPVQMTGVGDVLDAIPDLPEIPVVLINPGKHCPTGDVFRRFIGPMHGRVKIPGDVQSSDGLVAFLKTRDNDLTHAASEIVPEIGQCLNILAQQKNCALARMSGSGATVFGLFDRMEDAREATEVIARAFPEWWVRAGTVNTPERY